MRSMIVLASLFAALPAFAGNDSAYTDFDFKKCKQLTPAEEIGESSGLFECKGFKGLPVYFAEGDLRQVMAFGKGGQDHCAIHQSFGGFNSVGNKIEWRLKDGKPIASILRWSVSYDPENSEKQKSWLVVTKLEDGQSCRMGLVEGGFPNANEEARKIADTQWSKFRCAGGVPRVLANPGTDTSGLSEPDCLQ
jgi:hypothetical protein